MQKPLPVDKDTRSCRSIARLRVAQVHNLVFRARDNIPRIYDEKHILDPNSREAIRLASDLLETALILLHSAYLNEKTRGHRDERFAETAEFIFTAIGQQEYPAIWSYLNYKSHKEA